MQATIRDNIQTVRERIKAAAAAVGRDPEEITLIAVSKLHPAEDVDAAAECGILYFAENKVQELCKKQPLVKTDVRWHLIGHLQTNKVKQVIDKVCLIHSVDSLHLAEEIDKRAAQAGKVMDILIQVNAAGEESKFGVKVDEVLPLIEKISKLEQVSVMGLMTIAPYTDNPESNRTYFRQLKQLSVDIESKNIDNISMTVLSMGMTGDYQVAIEEGATHVRVGTGIFGERNYNI